MKNNYQEITSQTIDYLNIHYQDASVEDLCYILNCSDYTISKDVKKTTGKTYKQNLQEIRLLNCADLLINTTMSVIEVMLSVGYDNTTYFYKIFNNYFGVTPSIYRKENRKKVMSYC